MSIDSKTKRLVKEHVKKHINYPTTKDALIKACNDMSDFSKDQKTWFEKTLPSGNYRNANEVLKGLGW